MRFFTVFFDEMTLLPHEFNITKNQLKPRKLTLPCHSRWRPVVGNHIFSKNSKNQKIDNKKIFSNVLLTGVTIFAHFPRNPQFWAKKWHALARSGFFEVSKNSRGSPKFRVFNFLKKAQKFGNVYKPLVPFFAKKPGRKFFRVFRGPKS